MTRVRKATLGLSLVGSFCLVACGPSEGRKTEQRLLDERRALLRGVFDHFVEEDLRDTAKLKWKDTDSAADALRAGVRVPAHAKRIRSMNGGYFSAAEFASLVGFPPSITNDSGSELVWSAGSSATMRLYANFRLTETHSDLRDPEARARWEELGLRNLRLVDEQVNESMGRDFEGYSYRTEFRQRD